MTMFKCKGVGGSPTPSYNYELYDYIYTENTGEGFTTEIVRAPSNQAFGDIEIKLQKVDTTTPSSEVGYLGSIDATKGTYSGVRFYFGYKSNYSLYYGNDSGIYAKTAAFGTADNEIHTLLAKQKSSSLSSYNLYYDGVDSGNSGSIAGTFNYPFGLGCINNNGTWESGMQYLKIFYIKFYKYNSTDILYNFTPAKKLSTSEIGLYDTVNKVFYTSMGDGNFITGDPIGYA